MENFFDTVLSGSMTVGIFFLIVGVALVSGLVTSFIMSFKMKTSKRFFITNTILPAVVALVIALVNGSIGAGLAVAGAFGLVRFRSTNGTAEEIGSIFISVASGFAFGMGYLAYGAIISILFALVYIGLSYLNIWKHKGNTEMLLRITVPEDLNYGDAFEDTLAHFTKEHELIRVKTTNMGSLFKLSYRIRMKNDAEQKEFLDEIRERNGNLEVMVMPYADVAAETL